MHLPASQFSKIQTPPPQQEASPFAADRTIDLVKKFFIYKAMGSNLFINYALASVHFMYRIFGMRFTNFLIESTGGAVFTGGSDLKTLKHMRSTFQEKGIGTISCYVVEGVRQVENSTLDNFCKFTVRAIQQLAGDRETHFALKLTAYISTCLMEKLSQA